MTANQPKHAAMLKENPALSRFSAFQKFPRNAWYIAAGRDEITTEPFSRKLLGKPVVLYRKTDNSVAAMYDSCPHRGYPLSKSRVVGDNIQCMYHGITFDSQGKCVDMPATPNAQVSDKMCVTAYPVEERWHWVWIWMGDPKLADPADIPYFERQDYEHYDHRFYDPLPVECNFQIMHDNLSDASHTSFLHEGLLDDPDNIEMAAAEPQVDRIDDTTLRVTRTMNNFVPTADVAALYHLEAGVRYCRRLEVWHHMPGMLTAFNRYYLYDDNAENGEGKLVVEYVTILGLTPSSENTSFHLTAGTTSFEQTDADKDGLLFVIGQDLVAFKAIQEYFEEYSNEAVEVSTTSDKLGIMLRRIISTMLKNEEKLINAKDI